MYSNNDIYDFSQLKEVVLQLTHGKMEKPKTPLPVIQKTLNQDELLKNICFNEDGIFLQRNKDKIKGYIYIKKGYDIHYAKTNNIGTIVPKFHIYKCKTIEEQMEMNNFDGHYEFNNYPVKMKDIDGIEKELKLCKNCLNLSKNIKRVITVSEYCNNYINNNKIGGTFGKDDLPLPIQRDYKNYTSNWVNISNELRKRKNYTCSHCKITIDSNFADRRFIEVHHIDGNKANNHQDNLQVLCILCHAFMNKKHIGNYKKISNITRLSSFISRYEDKIKKHNIKYYQKAVALCNTNRSLKS